MRRKISPGAVIQRAGPGAAFVSVPPLPAPAGALAFSLWTDLTFTGPSLRQNAARDPMFPVSRIGEVRAMILGAPATNHADPRLSSLRAVYPDVRPVQIHVAKTGIPRGDTLRLQGPPPHVWPIFHNCLPEARDTPRRHGRFHPRVSDPKLSRKLTASATCASRTVSLPSRSAIVRATLRIR